MSHKEVARPGLVRAAQAGKITNAEGAQALGLSVRQFRRLRAAFAECGLAGLLHGNRGQRSGRRRGEKERARVLRLMQKKYRGFNDVHLTEKLVEVEKLSVSREWVRRLRREANLPAVHKRRPPKHRTRRTREGRVGALVLIDGSRHDWLEGRGPMFTLIGAVDDATGRLLALVVREQEDLHGYLELLGRLLRDHGVPLAFYGDRSGILVRNDRYWSLHEELRGRRDPTAFGAVLEELAIRFIPANSPQAKGRIERAWRTLQDRLVSELRLLGASSPEQVAAYLPTFLEQYNARFPVAPRESESAWRRPPQRLDLLLTCRYQRTVAGDDTVTVPGRWIQLPARGRGRAWRSRRVEVRECLDGRLLVLHQHEQIARQDWSGGAFTLVHRQSAHARRRCAENFGPVPTPTPKPKPPKRPGNRRGQITNMRSQAPEHPWRRPYRPTSPPV